MLISFLEIVLSSPSFEMLVSKRCRFFFGTSDNGVSSDLDSLPVVDGTGVFDIDFELEARERDEDVDVSLAVSFDGVDDRESGVSLLVSLQS